MVKSLFHPEGIKDGYCINGYKRKNHGHLRERAVSVAWSDAMLIWNVGSASGLPEWSADSPYCRYESEFNVYSVFPSFSPRRDEFRTVYWTYPAEAEDLASVEQTLKDAGYTKSDAGWWESEDALWTLVSGEYSWLTKYSVAVMDSTQVALSWPVVATSAPQVDVDLSEARAIFASQPEALRLFEQAVDALNRDQTVLSTAWPFAVSPTLVGLWPVWPSPYLVIGSLHPWQQTFLQTLTGGAK